MENFSFSIMHDEICGVDQQQDDFSFNGILSKPIHRRSFMLSMIIMHSRYLQILVQFWFTIEPSSS